MSDYERLKAMLAKTPYLIVEPGGDVCLASTGETFKLLAERDRNFSKGIINAEAALRHFAELPAVGTEDRTFRTEEMCTIMDIELGAFRVNWTDVLKPSLPRQGHRFVWSWSDAFAAGCVGAFRRLGVLKSTLAKIQPLFAEAQTKKQPRQKLATSAEA